MSTFPVFVVPVLLALFAPRLVELVAARLVARGVARAEAALGLRPGSRRGASAA